MDINVGTTCDKNKIISFKWSVVFVTSTSQEHYNIYNILQTSSSELCVKPWDSSDEDS